MIRNKIILSLIICFGALSAKSQNEKGQTVFGANIGFGAARVYVHALMLDSLLEEDVKSKTTPALIFGADYGLHKRFSLGFQFATQSISGTVNGHLFIDGNSAIVEEDYAYKARRTHISITPKFHYVVDNEKLDLYSGLRIGRVMWNASNDSQDPNVYNLNDDLVDRNSLGLIAFGAKVYFTKSFGANAEINFGPPYFFTFGLSYKIGGED